MRVYRQKDYPNVKLGLSTTDSIASAGCLLCCFAMISGKDPLEVNNIFISNGVYVKKDMIVPYKAAQALGLDYEGQSALNMVGYPVIAETNYYKNQGYPQHFYVMIDEHTIADPIDGKIKPNPYNIVSYLSVKSKDMPQAFDLFKVDGEDTIVMRTWNGYEAIPNAIELHNRFGNNPVVGTITRSEVNTSLVDGWQGRQSTIDINSALKFIRDYSSKL